MTDKSKVQLGKSEGNELQNSAEIESEQASVIQDPLIQLTRLGSRRSIRIIMLCAGLSVFAHSPAFEPYLKAAFDTLIAEPYNSWKKEEELRINLKKLEKELLEKYKEDKRLIEERNKPRIVRIQERVKEREAFKAWIRENYETLSKADIFFPLEYLSQGLSDEELHASTEVFSMKSDEIHINDAEDPQDEELKLMAEIFMPAGSYDRTKSSAISTLAKNLCENSQNCVARARIIAMELATKYPKLQKYIFFQKYGDHIRVVFEFKDRRVIIDSGEVTSFPDAVTNNFKNIVMPLDVWLAIYAGIPRKNFVDRIEHYGPDKKTTEDYARMTDELVEFPEEDDLDNLATAKTWFADFDGNPKHATKNKNAQDGHGSKGNQNQDGQNNGLPKGKPATTSESTVLDKKQDVLMSSADKAPAPQELRYDFEEITAEQMKAFIPENLAQGRYSSITFPHLKSLHLDASKVLIERIKKLYNLSIRFDVLPTLPKDVAEEFSQLSNGTSFTFPGFSELSEETASGFRDNKCQLEFPNLKIFSAKAAIAFAGPEYGMEDIMEVELLPGDFSIPKGNVRPTFNERPRGRLNIGGLIGLSKEAGHALGRYNGWGMNFINCHISEGAMEGISHRANQTTFADFPETETFAGLKGTKTNLTIVGPKMNVEQAKNLGETAGSLTIYVDDIPTEAYRYLAKFKGNLQIAGRSKPIHMNLEISDALSTHEGGLTINTDEFTLEEAENFAKTKGQLNITVPSMHADVARILIKRDVQMTTIIDIHDDIDADTLRVFASSNHVIVSGLKTLNPEKVQILGNGKNRSIQCGSVSYVDLPTVTAIAQMPYMPDIGFPMTTEFAHELAKHKGRLTINGTITVEIARELAKHVGPLSIMDGHISPEVAMELGKHHGDISFQMLNDVTLDLVVGLAPLEGRLWMGNARVRDKEVAKILYLRINSRPASQATTVWQEHMKRITNPDDPDVWIDRVEYQGPQ